MELGSRKKSRRNSMMRLKSFDTQEVREIGRKEAGESRGFPILWMEITEFYYELIMLGLHVFRQTGPPRLVDCLTPSPEDGVIQSSALPKNTIA